MGDSGLFILSIIIGIIIAIVLWKIFWAKEKKDEINRTYNNQNSSFNLHIELIENKTAALLSWTNAPGVVNGYRIFRESPLGSGFYCIVNNTGPNVLNWVDRGLNPNSEYGYKITVL